MTMHLGRGQYTLPLLTARINSFLVCGSEYHDRWVLEGV